ncbi:MAG TPA: hypothetical protein VNI20_12765, partial [Fimbriimonadaceae bacterium]|nr:hypothetical protein [Fimbriimonadaceae bacterium]
ALLFGGQTADYNALVDRWSTAARSAEWSVGVVPNVVFDVLAYTVEAVVIFFAFFYVLRLWKALLILGKAITTDRRFTFDPWIQDRENKLGLGSLGSVFTGFLLIVVLFLFYVAFHAIQLDAWHRGYLEFDYVRKVASDYWALALSFRGQYPDWNLLFGDTRITGYTDPGMRILLATIVIPITAVVYVPLFMIKNYLGTLIDNERNVGRAKLRELQSQGVLDDDPRVKAIDARWNKLQAAQVWPCGNAVALRYFSYMSLLVLSAFLPRLGILVCTGIVVAVFARKVVPWLPAKEKK